MFVFNWLSIQGKILKNSYKENKKEFFLRDLWHTFILLFGLGLLFLFLYAMFNFIGNKGLPAFDFAFILLSFSLLVFIPLVFYSAIVCGLSFLFQKEEIQFYFSMPVNRLSVFTVKFLQAYFHTNWMAFLAFTVFLAALQTYFKTTALIYLSGVISFLIFLLIPVCLAVILIIVISRFIPFVQEKGILTVIGLFVGSILVAAIRVMQPEQLATAEGKMRLVTFVQNLHKPWMTVLPSEWVTSILFAQIQKDAGGVAVNFLILLFFALVCLLLTYVTAAFFYKKTWSDSVAISSLVEKKFAWHNMLRFLPSTLRGFVRKDLLSFYRDTVEKGSLLILIPLTFVYLYSVYLLNRQIQAATAELFFSLLFIYLFNFFYSSVVIAGLSGRWIFPSVSAEGNNFRLIKGSATSLEDFMKAKFFLGFAPLFLLGQILIVSSSCILHLQFYFILASVLVMTVLCFGITMICLILGMRQADFTIKAPLDFALSMRGFLCLVWESIFVGIIIILVGIPAAIFLGKGLCAQFILSLAISVVIAFFVLKMLHQSYKSSLVLLSKREV